MESSYTVHALVAWDKEILEEKFGPTSELEPVTDLEREYWALEDDQPKGKQNKKAQKSGNKGLKRPMKKAKKKNNKQKDLAGQ
jgi:hypothetical protein